MRLFLLPIILSLLGCHTSSTQQHSTINDVDKTAVAAVLTEFLEAGDIQDAARLDPVLHPSFRILINQFMGSPDVLILDRSTYVGMIADKKLGGDPRISVTQSVEIVGNLGFVRAKVSNSELLFDTLYTLVKDLTGKWWLAAEAPYVSPI